MEEDKAHHSPSKQFLQPSYLGGGRGKCRQVQMTYGDLQAFQGKRSSEGGCHYLLLYSDPGLPWCYSIQELIRADPRSEEMGHLVQGRLPRVMTKPGLELLQFLELT